MKNNKKINVGIIGGSGFTGGELCRLLIKHQNVKNIYPTSRGTESFNRTHPNLIKANLKFISVESLIKKKNIDVVFLCTKASQSIEYAEIFRKKNVIVIDLSGAFRFNTSKKYLEAYGKEHSNKKLLKTASYGLSEFNINNIKKSFLISNPGCYAICALYSLAPLTKTKFIDFKNTIKIHAINGTTGAGISPRKEISHKNVMENMLAYNADGHRHAPEIEEKLNNFFNLENSVVDLNTAHGNFRRGIFMQISLELKRKFPK